MTLRQFQIFTVLAEELHFGRAAEKLHLAQPALSNHIKALEYDLGVTLFHRTTRRVRLTAAGEAFLPEALATIAQAEAAVRITRAMGETGADTLKLGGVDSATAGLLPSVIRSFRLARPEVALKVFEMLSGPAFNMLESQALDIAFVRKPPHVDHLSSRHLMSEPVMVALPAQHPKARQHSISTADIREEQLVMSSRASRPILFDVIMDYLRNRDVTPNILQEATERHMIIAMVASGLGISLVPKWVSNFRREDVVFLPLDDGGPAVEVHAVWRTGEQLQTVHDFLSFLPSVTQP
ncbi:LysR substrate-binding domain-containing protein [Roseobacter sp. CCS2]|uniref:LysR substrate-binding domain-containing protein n=1 Tax=Roseobacter sp. CCS2 TaxID=391593 RepID=UPI0000F3E3BB|nr:LysR substrate-binding domain-containing protein [Roseobacter sp. CCS2]EBA12641.1 Transcriptional Regulator, LysR family protein [Roseobacter sp. CCS2]